MNYFPVLQKNQLRNYIYYMLSDIFIFVKILKLQFMPKFEYCGNISEGFNL